MKIKILTAVIIVSLYGSSMANVPLFDGSKAFQLLEKQCDMGPRTPGSKAHEQCLNWMLDHLESSGFSVQKQPFPFTNPKSGRVLMLHNVIASLGIQKNRMLLCAHWDTRPWADADPDPANHVQPVMGANDGASGVAVLLEIARLIKKNPPSVGVDIVLFDGEDAGLSGQNDTWCQGSSYFADHLPISATNTRAILIDMIGDRDLVLPKEGYSSQYAPGLIRIVWQKAKRLGLSSFQSKIGPFVIDDHIQLLRVGIPAIDIIDFNYPYWHTVEDTPDKCSPESLETIGTLILHVLYEF